MDELTFAFTQDGLVAVVNGTEEISDLEGLLTRAPDVPAPAARVRLAPTPRAAAQELAAWEKADASAGSKPAAQLEPSHAAQVASMQKLYELNRMEVLLAQSKKLAGLNV